MSEYKEMNTEHLISEMVYLCLEVPPELAQEIATRNDAISYLRDILQNGKYWDHGGPGDAWTPYHVIHILALIKIKEALELLLETMRNKNDLLGDWITESTPTLLAAFGESAIERLKECVLDEKLDLYIRGSIATALNVIAHQHPDKKEEIKAFLTKLLDDTNDPTFAAFLIDEVLSFKDPNLVPQVRKAFEDGKIDTDVISQYDVDWVFNLPEEEQSYSKFMKSPLEHFSRENINYLKKISYPKKETPTKKTKTKIGRNDPCPCGSGKKYKKCCMKK
ncbi:MAG: DUF1186 domain-containing protein [Candidatus Methanoperedens sp.]|nr:DUF1186 domain-containing protein [Candidatus Methanoperedens sp.]